MRIGALLAFLLSATLAISCAGTGSGPLPGVPATDAAGPAVPGSGWPALLPADGVQPWEAHAPRALTAAGEFAAGAERFSESGDVQSLDEAAQLGSGAAGEQAVSYAIYRLNPAGQPGVVSADVNVHPRQGAGGEPSSYFIGLADYGAGVWEWHGPFTDHHVRLLAAEGVAAGADYLSSLGHLFVVLLAYDGSRFDVIAVGAETFDPADTTPPPVPQGVTATPRPGAVELGWQAVIAGDLAGYRVYWNTQHFFDERGTGVRHVDYLEGNTRFLLNPASGGADFVRALEQGLPVFVRIAALDSAGQASALSSILKATPLSGSVPPLIINLSTASALRDDVVTLNASGAASYDFDLDGDGSFDLTGDTTGNAQLVTSQTGIIRAAVRASVGSGDGMAVALGGASLLVTGNTRPAASATASPQSGSAPLTVTFTGAAEDEEDAAGDLSFAWDFNGDGIFEPGTDTLTPPAQQYPAPGLFNAKFRVEDADGAWAVDTVGVLVTAPGANIPPSADLAADYYTQFLNMENQAPVEFSAALSADPEGGALSYEFDPEGTGNWQVVPGSVFNHIYTRRGVFQARLRVTDPDGASASAAVQVRVLGATPVVHETIANTGWMSGLALVQGNPAIAHWDWVDTRLYYHRADDALGSGWPASMSIGPQFNSYAPGTTLMVSGGKPAISFAPLGGDELLFIRALDELGASWPPNPVVVDPGPGSYGASMTLVEGDPAIAFIDFDNNLVEFVHAQDPVGSFWDPSIPVDVGSFGGVPCLEVIGGHPCIALHDFASSEIRFYRCNDPAGIDWPNEVVAGEFSSNSYNLDLTEVDGRPAILFTERDDPGTEVETLFYTIAEDAEGNSWIPQLELNTAEPGFIIRDCNLVVISGRPVAFYNGNGLKVQTGDDAQGTSWSPPQQLGLFLTQLDVILDPAGNPLVAGWTNGAPTFYYCRPY